MLRPSNPAVAPVARVRPAPVKASSSPAPRPAGRLHAALLVVAAIFAGGAAAQSGSSGLPPAALQLEHCVERFEFPLEAQIRKGKAALASTDVGNITVIEYDGDYSRGLNLPRVEVAQRFYQDHADAYDFLIVFTTFEFATGNALAFYNGVRNDVDGIGEERFDVSAQLGSGAM